jgi:tetratricopeptide (TPR) repeat protein
MRRFVTLLLCALFCLPAFSQADRREVRSGNRKYKKGDVKEAELEYRKAMVRDSLSVAALNNLGCALHKQGDNDGAAKMWSKAADQLKGDEPGQAREWFNMGCSALAKKDYAAAVAAFKEALLRDPGDMDAKERYSYAKRMLQQQQNQDQQNQNQQNQDQQDQNQQNQDQQDQNQQNQDQQDQDDRQDQDQQDQNREPKISPQQAQQVLRAIQAQEKETQDKVKKEKAELLKSRQKDKNW